MRKTFAILLVFWMAACTAVPSPEAPPGNPEIPPTIPDITETPTKFIPASMTPSITLTPSVTPAGSATAAPTRMPATLVIPTLQPGSSLGLSTIQMINAEVGWGMYTRPEKDFRPDIRLDFTTPSQPEGYILRTADGGKTWQNVTPPTGAYSPGGFFALDANTAWASDNVPCCSEVTDTSIWHTSDGGQTWQPSQPFSIEPNDQFYLPFRMQFIDQNTGWLLSIVSLGMSASLGYLLLHTTDGGETWRAIYRVGGCHSVGFVFINSTTGWYGANCFSQGVVYDHLEFFFRAGGLELEKTTNGGDTFDETTLLPMPDELQQPELAKLDSECDETRMLPISSDAVGVEWGCHIFTNGTEYRYFALTTDGGRTWNTWKPAGNEYFFDATHGWRLLSPGQLQQTTDSGLNWVTLKTVGWEGAQFDFISEQEGWALVNDTNSSAFVHTADGGKTWEEIKPVIASQ